jgi:hypothetical protein
VVDQRKISCLSPKTGSRKQQRSVSVKGGERREEEALNDTPGHRILSRRVEEVKAMVASKKINFDVNASVRKRLKSRTFDKEVSRWMPNPTKHWGPKKRAAGKAAAQTHRKRAKKGKGAE